MEISALGVDYGTMSYLRIGELANRTGASVETLRYYESEGLLPEPKRSDGGYRLYTPEDEHRVHFIRRARGMDFSLREVAELLSLKVDREQVTCGEVKQLAEQKLAAIETKITELKKMEGALKQITDACEGGDTSAVYCTILDALES